MTTARWTTLTAAVAAMLGGIATEQDTRLSAAFFAVGFLLLGAWLVLEIKGRDG